MKDAWLKKWNDRFGENEYAYGEQPNEYLKEQLGGLKNGTILFPAEGEGRNAVYAAKLGWTVSAFDISDAGKNKALQLAKKDNVSLDYQIGELETLNYKNEQFDAIALIYAHFPPNIKSALHKKLSTLLRSGGTVIFEAFGKNHLKYRDENPKVGGPNNLDALFSVEELKSDFKDFEILELVEKEVQLNEGLYHNGKASVVRFAGRKR